MQSVVSVNRNHKDTVFRDLFGTEKNKANALSLYNALNGSSYTDTSLLELTTIDNVIYMGVKNDISFFINDEMILWEHQSTHNPNMPLRGLTYFATLYNIWLETHDLSAYGHRLIKLPTPRYFVFFVGEEDRPDREVMRLSDAFAQGAGDVEVSVTVLNVTAGHNPGLMEACDTLAGYAHLVKLIRGYNESMDLRDAVDVAVRECIADGVLAEYLTEKRSTVREMFLNEYDEATTRRRLHRDAVLEGLEEGRKEGRKEGRNSILVNVRKKIALGSMSVEDALELGFTRDEL